MLQVTNLAFFRARRGRSEALGAALAALVEPTRLEAGCLPKVKYTTIELRGKILVMPVKAA
jgi:quinol monooxygenase YgiN